MPHDEVTTVSSAASPLPPAPPAPRPRLAYASSIYAALLLFGLTAIGLYLLVRLQFLLILLFLAVLVASGIAGPVRRLERLGLRRGLAILVVYAVIAGVLGLISWYVLPRLLGQAVDIALDLPRRLEDARQVQERVDELSQDYPILRDLDARLLALANNAGAEVTARLLAMPGAIAKALFSLTSIFTIAFLLLMTKERLLILVLSVTHPRHRPQTQRVLAEMGERLGAYLRAKVIVIVIIGALVWVTLFFLGSDYAILVAIFAGLMEALPRIGPWIGRAAIFLAVIPLGWEAVVVAMIAHVVIENLKGYVISPLVESGQVDIHPLTAFVAIIAGSLLLGWLGALIAVPIAAVIQVIVEDVVLPWRRAQLAAVEEAYAVGPPTPEPIGGHGTWLPGDGAGDGAAVSPPPAAAPLRGASRPSGTGGS